MGLLFCIALVILLMGSLILPWLHRARIKELSEQVEGLQLQILQLKYAESRVDADNTLPRNSVFPSRQTQSPKPAPVATAPKSEEKPVEPSVTKQAKLKQNTAPVYERPQTSEINLEQQFGAKLPVWIGGVALALAGLFMVKYSIEAGLLSPMVRLIIGVVFGAALLVVGQFIRNKHDVANGERIAQALSGAGIADLYACLFTASSIYHILPPSIAFTGMAAVTALAVTLSLRHGAPIALLGLVGGFLTPALVGSAEPDAPLLFVYLYFVVTGLFWVIRKKNWWVLSIPAVIGAYLWIAIWLVTDFSPDDAPWLGMFLVAVSATVVFQTRKAIDEGLADMADSFPLPKALNYLTLGGSAILLAVVTEKANFGGMEWALFGLLAAGGIVLAHFNYKVYGFAPWFSMLVNAVMLYAWQIDAATLAMTIAAFATLYMVSGYLLMWRSRSSAAVLSWAMLAGISSVIYYLLGYVRLHYLLNTYISDHMVWLEGKPFWGALAIALSGASVSAVNEVLEHYAEDNAIKQKLLAVFAVTATVFLSIGMTIELHRDFLSVALAGEILAICWINTHLDIKALRPIAALLACAFALALLPQILLLIQVTLYSLVEARIYLQRGIPIVNWPIFQLGLPAFMFAGSSILLRREKDNLLVATFETIAIALVAIMGYYITRHLFHIGENILFTKAGFTERGVITNVIFLYGLACLWLGKHYTRAAVTKGGFIFSAIALFRIAYFDCFIYNPVWAHQSVGSIPLFNSLLITYSLPILLLGYANGYLRNTTREHYVKFTHYFMLVLVMAVVSLNVRQFYHGEYLDTGITSNAEIYTYSAIWLVTGIVILLLGTWKQSPSLRMASLAILMLTVAKVFLYDASQLTGLLRVFSFFGLGVSLIGLSWFYTRFTIAKR